MNATPKHPESGWPIVEGNRYSESPGVGGNVFEVVDVMANSVLVRYVGDDGTLEHDAVEYLVSEFEDFYEL